MVDLLVLFLYCVLLTQSTGISIIDRILQFSSVVSNYRSNLTSPKWKNFRGSRIECQDKIRLNNVIWRTWHQQCNDKHSIFVFLLIVSRIIILDIRKTKSLVCQFVSPLDTQTLPVII